MPEISSSASTTLRKVAIIEPAIQLQAEPQAGEQRR
jgi:hypothetical protein